MLNFFKGLWKSVTSIFSKQKATEEQKQVSKQKATEEQKQEALKFFTENPNIGLNHKEILNFFTNQKVKDAALTFFNDYKSSGKITFVQTVKAFCDEDVIKRFVTDADKEPPAPLWLASLRHFVEHSTSSNLTWRETANALKSTDRSFNNGSLHFEDAVKIFREPTPLPPRPEFLPPLPLREPPALPEGYRLKKAAEAAAKSKVSSAPVDRGPPPPLPPRPSPAVVSKKSETRTAPIEHQPETGAGSAKAASRAAPPPLPPPPSTPPPMANPPTGAAPHTKKLASPPKPAPRCQPVGVGTLQQAPLGDVANLTF